MTIKPQKILILAANPKQTLRLRLDEELRDIEEGLQRAQNRDNFELRSKWAVRSRDIRRAILDYRPNIIHFSGHGAGVQGQGYFILNVGVVWYNSARLQARVFAPISQLAIIEAFVEIEDPRRRAGQRHNLTLCLALFTLAIPAGNKGFLVIGDWIDSYKEQLIDLFKPPKGRLPSYSTIRRTLLHIEYKQYSGCLARFFDVQPQIGETIALDGKVLRGSYQIEDDNPNCESHPAIMQGECIHCRARLNFGAKRS